MKIIIISARTDEAVYKEAAKRREKNKFLMYSQVELHTHFRMYPDFASSFIASVVNFLIMAFILFCLLKAVNKVTSLGTKKEEPAAPTTKKCPFCMSEIDIKATRCPHCTSQLPEENAE